MIRYSIRLLGEYTDHLLLMGLFVVGGSLLALAFVLEIVREADVWTGFLGTFAVMAMSMSLLGYAILLSAKGILIYRRQRGFT